MKERAMRKRLLASFTALAVAGGAAAQVAQQPSQGSGQPPPTLGQIGLFIYAAKGQSAEQQAADEAACTSWAEAQTGLQLQAGKVDTEAAAKAAEQQAKEATQGAMVKGAAKGALAGTAIGAIAGDTGTGAAIGAAAGAMGGRRARKQARQQAAQKGAQQAEAQGQQALETFKKAAGACLEGRGYTVK
jgi:hypothetical protein